MTSRDATCRFLAEHHHTRDTGTHKKLKPTEEVIATMMEHPSATGRWLGAEASKRIATIDEERLTTHASFLAKEHNLFAIKEKDDKLWSSTVTKLPEKHFTFAVTPSLTAPTSADGEIVIWSVHHLLQDWEAEQTNPSTCSQSLPSCHTTQQIQRTTWLTAFWKFFSNISSNTSNNTSKVVADLAGQPYTLPASLLTHLRPALVVHSPGKLYLLELTVCCEANFMSAKLRKESKYLHLVEQAHSVWTQATLSTIQVRCRGFIDSKSLHHLFTLAPTMILK